MARVVDVEFSVPVSFSPVDQYLDIEDELQIDLDDIEARALSWDQVAALTWQHVVITVICAPRSTVGSTMRVRTASPSVKPARSSDSAMVARHCRVWAAASPTCTTLASASRGSVPET